MLNSISDNIFKMNVFGDLGERFIDRVHNWSEDGEIFTGKSVKEYQKFIDKTKPKEFVSRSYSLPWYPPTKSQKHALVKVERFLDLPEYEAKLHPLRMLIIGAAGVGKSWLIERIVANFTARGRKCLVTAPTGPASHLIEGQTLHSAFAVPYLKDCDWETLAGRTDPTDRLRDRLHGLDLLVIDEVSMLGAGFLHYIDQQLRKCMQNSTPFGSVSIIMGGDIPSQIPPIGDVALYRDPGKYNEFIATGIKLYQWIMTDVVILRENVRTQFCEEQKRLLFNLRRKQIGPGDLHILNKRLEQNIDPDILNSEFSDCIRIFPRRAMVNNYNRQKIVELGMPVIRVGIRQQPNQPELKNYEPLVIGKGVKVMLTRNLDTARGLTTGARGMVTAILWDKKKLPGRDLPACVMIEFDVTVRGPRVELNSIPVPIVTDFFYCQITNKTYKVESFPLRVAYAATVHSVQGQTLDKACIYLDVPLAENQDYVALSRTRSVEDFVLLDKCIKGDRFETPKFYRGLNDQMTEFRRIGILHEVMGSDYEPSCNVFKTQGEEVDLLSEEQDNPPLSDALMDSQLEDFRQEWIEEINSRYKPLSLTNLVQALEESGEQYREEEKFIHSVLYDSVDKDNTSIVRQDDDDEPLHHTKFPDPSHSFVDEDVIEFPLVQTSHNADECDSYMDIDSPDSPEIPDFLSLGLKEEAGEYIAQYLSSSDGQVLLKQIEDSIKTTFVPSQESSFSETKPPSDPRLSSHWYQKSSNVNPHSAHFLSQEESIIFDDLCELSDSLSLTSCEENLSSININHITSDTGVNGLLKEEVDQIMTDLSGDFENKDTDYHWF